jgi:quercetin dioxygenase-like cupin family protein
VKRVVTGVNAEGRSHVISQDELPDKQRLTVWDYSPGDAVQAWISDLDATSTADWVGPKNAGGAKLVWATVLPNSEQMSARQAPGFDENGMHTTATLDFDYIVDGRLTLILDEESVEVERGDFVIVQTGSHAWRNDTDAAAVMVAFVLRPSESG